MEEDWRSVKGEDPLGGSPGGASCSTEVFTATTARESFTYDIIQAYLS